MSKNLYFLGIIPPDEIAFEITGMKQFCAGKFHAVHAMKSPPHITVVPPFRADLPGDKIMLDHLAVEAKKQKPFYIELKGFDHFSNRVVFVATDQSEHLTKIHSHFLSLINQLFPADNQKDVRFHAHMTIAFKDINPTQFEGIWDHFKDQDYARMFLCREIVLLKYSDHNWSPFKSFQFGS